MRKYYLLRHDDHTRLIYRMPDRAFIPIDVKNNDYQNYIQWVKEGNVAREINDPDKDIV